MTGPDRDEPRDAAERLAEHIRAVVDAAPPLSDEMVEKLRALLPPVPDDPPALVAGDRVAVAVPARSRPLYGLLLGKAEGRDGEVATVRVNGSRGERVIDVPMAWLRPWRPRPGRP